MLLAKEFLKERRLRLAQRIHVSDIPFGGFNKGDKVPFRLEHGFRLPNLLLPFETQKIDNSWVSHIGVVMEPSLDIFLRLLDWNFEQFVLCKNVGK